MEKLIFNLQSFDMNAKYCLTFNYCVDWGKNLVTLERDTIFILQMKGRWKMIFWKLWKLENVKLFLKDDVR